MTRLSLFGKTRIGKHGDKHHYMPCVPAECLGFCFEAEQLPSVLRAARTHHRRAGCGLSMAAGPNVRDRFCVGPAGDTAFPLAGVAVHDTAGAVDLSLGELVPCPCCLEDLAPLHCGFCRLHREVPEVPASLFRLWQQDGFTFNLAEVCHSVGWRLSKIEEMDLYIKTARANLARTNK